MKIVIESTSEVGCTTEGVRVRRWTGVTENGHKCAVMVLGVYAPAEDPAAVKEIAAELCDKGDLQILPFTVQAARFQAADAEPPGLARFSAAWRRLHAEGKAPNYVSSTSAMAYKEWLLSGRPEPAAWIVAYLNRQKER